MSPYDEKVGAFDSSFHFGLQENQFFDVSGKYLNTVFEVCFDPAHQLISRRLSRAD